MPSPFGIEEPVDHQTGGDELRAIHNMHNAAQPGAGGRPQAGVESASCVCASLRWPMHALWVATLSQRPAEPPKRLSWSPYRLAREERWSRYRNGGPRTAPHRTTPLCGREAPICS